MRIVEWHQLDESGRRDLLRRPAASRSAAVSAAVHEIIAEVRREGDEAVKRLTQRFDGPALSSLAVSAQEFAAAEAALTPAQHTAIDRAIDTVRTFHAAQLSPPVRIETAPGVICERTSLPIRSVGLYVPAGSAPLPSTAIMLAVPASLARCPTRVLCTPPARDGAANAAVLVAARRAGVECVFKIGGAQAIAAMAYGTRSVPKCDKTYGPGNAYVTAAKLACAQDPQGAASDLPAGVTEVMVVADATARADFVAADLLAQAEHSEEAQALLVTTSLALAQAVAAELERQIPALSRAAVLNESVKAIRLIVVEDLKSALAIANDYAPEHLLLQTQAPRDLLPEVAAAGAVFIGNFSPESLGDYCSGPNHTLPTYGYARAYSGLSLEDFQKRMTIQEVSPRGLRELGPTAETLALLEGLDAHAQSVRIRLGALP
jgi:histidinol dehydrogenase